MELTLSLDDKTDPSHSKNFTGEKNGLNEKSNRNHDSQKPDTKSGVDLGISTINYYDVIIIGGGLTGLRAAIQFADAGLKGAIISKVHPLRSHSVAAQGGMNASLGNVLGEDSSKDSWEMHAYDTIKGSDYLADQDAVALMCQEATHSVLELEHMGTAWSRLENGKIAQRPFGGADFPRTCYAADRSGHNALHTLYEQVVKREIPVYEEFFVTSLVTHEDRCVGCTALDIMTGNVHGFSAKALLLATGGFGRIFSNSTNALINTGDGHFLALKAGVPLKDMEFVQFHPTTLYGTNILITEGARGEGGILLNNNNERFMKKYAPHSQDLAPRDVVARSIEQELANGRGFDGGYVHLDLRQVGSEKIKERLPGIRQISMDFAGIDPIKYPIPVQPGQHYSMGGIHVDITGSTPLSGLYAAGECACVSVHGANRLGGNSLLETVVFGRLVADTMLKDLKDIGEVPTDEILISVLKMAIQNVNSHIDQIISRKDGKNLFKIREKMKKTMNNRFGISREGKGMKEGLREIKNMQDSISKISIDFKERATNQRLIQLLELEGMLYIAETVAIGAIARQESRGSHYRRDYKKRNDSEFLKHTLTHLDDGKIKLSYKNVNLGIFEPEERVY